MAAERSEAQEIFERQEREREQFVRSLIDKLNEANFDWVLPEHFQQHVNFRGKGLTINDNSSEEAFSSRISTILHPDQGLVTVLPNGSISPQNIKFLPMAKIVALEERVNETLSKLQAIRTQ